MYTVERVFFGSVFLSGIFVKIQKITIFQISTHKKCDWILAKNMNLKQKVTGKVFN